MAEMYNYYCPHCGQGYSVGKFDLQHFLCPKPDCQFKFKGLQGKAVVVPKFSTIFDTAVESKFKDKRFSEVGTKKIFDDVLDGDIEVEVEVKQQEITDNGIDNDERQEIDTASPPRKERKKSKRKN